VQLPKNLAVTCEITLLAQQFVGNLISPNLKKCKFLKLSCKFAVNKGNWLAQWQLLELLLSLAQIESNNWQFVLSPAQLVKGPVSMTDPESWSL
jgi:hypothetical protein